MVNIIPVEPERHAGKGCRWNAGYPFAAAQSLVPVSGFEIPRAAVAMPIAFVEQSGRYLPVAVTSPVQGRNLFIGPSAQWLGSYLPAVLQSYPFRLGRVKDSDKVILCIDEDSGWIVNAGENAPRFFEEDGSPAAVLKMMMEFLQRIEQNRSATDLAVAALAEARLIRPWPLTVAIDNQKVTTSGLYCIDEPALNALDEEKFLRLRKLGALVLAYAQLLSMQTIGAFAQLATVQQQLAQQARPLPPVSSLFTTDDGGTIKFN